MRTYSKKDLGPTGEKFELELRADIALANMRTRGSGQTPWEALMEHVIRLERRISRIEGHLRL